MILVIKKIVSKVVVSQKVTNFAAVKMQVLNMTKQQFQVAIPAQKNFTSAWFFMPIDLVNSNNCVNTHTHTGRDQYKGTRNARVIYNRNTDNQRVCMKFFQSFVHTFFVW